MSNDATPPAPATDDDPINWGAWSVWAVIIMLGAALALWSAMTGQWVVAVMAIPAFVLFAIQIAPYPFSSQPPDAIAICGPRRRLGGVGLDERQRALRSDADEWMSNLGHLGLIAAFVVATLTGHLALGSWLMAGAVGWHVVRFALLWLLSRKY